MPQTINSAGYVYFLAFQELQRMHLQRPDYKIEEKVTGSWGWGELQATGYRGLTVL